MKYILNRGILILGLITAISVLVTGNYFMVTADAQITPSMKNEEGNWTGSIQINSIIRDAFDPLIQVTLSDAASSAQKHVGENSSAIASFIHPSKGYLVYMTYVLDGDSQVTKVIVDAGNGQILDSSKMSIEEFMNKFHPSKQSMQGPMYMHGQTTK